MNDATLVGTAGLEPARIAPTDFKSGASTYFATSPLGCFVRQACFQGKALMSQA